MDKDQIKIDLVKKLAEEMFKSDKIEFTQQLDPIQNRRIFRAYTYVGSKQMVSILRGQNQPLSQDKIERIHDTLIKSGYNIPPTVLVDIIDLVDNMRSAP
jgi:ribosomal protein S17E